jgi:hypothetical protein
MAKKSKDSGFDFSKISNVVDNLSKKSMITIENIDAERSYISTGIHILDALISKSIKNGGIPNNRITIFAGPPQTGKSYIALSIARNAQKDDYNIIYIDTEFAIEKSDFDMYGVDTSDPDKFMLLRTNKVENIKIFLTQLLDELKKQKEKGIDVSKTLIILDSVGALASIKEVEDALDAKNKQDMTRAKSIKSLFRIISSDLGYLNIPLVATNHIYMCLTGDHEILKSDGTYVHIKDVKDGDIVKTLNGDKPVEDTVEYKKSPIMKITLEDGYEIKCTPEHKFLVKEEWTNDKNDSCWKSANELNEDDIILKIVMKSFEEVKVKKIEYLKDKETTYDIQIKDSHHYVLKNGVVSHNTQDLFPQMVQSGGEGLNYSASIIVYLTIAKLRTGNEDELDLGQSGVIVTAKSRKNRLAKPKKIKFEIDHSRGVNPYKGLDYFCTPETFDKVGIAKVKKEVDKKTGEITYKDGGTRYYVRHLDKYLYEKNLYNSEVFNKDVIDALEPIIYDYFRYASYEEYQKELEKLEEEYSKFEEDNDEFDIDLDDDSKLFE